MIYQEEKTSTESDWPGARLGTLLCCWARMFTCGMCFYSSPSCVVPTTGPQQTPLCIRSASFHPGAVFRRHGAVVHAAAFEFHTQILLLNCCWESSIISILLPFWKKINIISWEFHQYFYMIWLKLSSFKTACLSKQKITLQIIIFNGLL